MTPTTAVIVSLVSAAVAVVTVIINGRSTVRADCRNDTAATLAMKDERIEELETKVSRLQSDVDELAAKVRSLEQRLDQYGCWNAPHCTSWKPLSGPKPTGTI